MAIIIKNANEIEKMSVACKIVKDTLDLVGKNLSIGISTKELDKIAENFILSQGAIPSFKGYHGYPASICVSINEEVIHGIPGDRIIKDGDVVSVDVGAYINGYHGDAARTFSVGEISLDAKNLIEVTKQSFFEGIKFAKEGYNLLDISAAIQNHVEKSGYFVVKDFVGHGIGKNMHEEPQVPNYKTKIRKIGSVNPKLKKGMTLAIEPMVNVGGSEVLVLDDGWTVVTKNKKLSAHYENTIAITDGEPLILTY